MTETEQTTPRDMFRVDTGINYHGSAATRWYANVWGASGKLGSLLGTQDEIEEAKRRLEGVAFGEEPR